MNTETSEKYHFYFGGSVLKPLFLHIREIFVQNSKLKIFEAIINEGKWK